jgi:spectinomycin phosphotransferase
MLEKPDIAEELIASWVNIHYRLDITQVTFLPIGYDINTAVYRIVDRTGREYFLKLRKGNFNSIGVTVPYYLNKLGIYTVIPSIETTDGQLFGRVENFTILLYPFIPGKDGYELKLENRHWKELGWTLKRVHTASLPQMLATLIPSEVYDPQWRETVRYFQGQVEDTAYTDPVARKLSRFLLEKRDVINQLVGRADELARAMVQQPVEMVLCHSDAHPGNYFIAESGEFYLVDWDTLVFAAKERDLMFISSGMEGDQAGGWEASFYEGYGPVDFNQRALAYYRNERIVQDIAEFCKQLLLTDRGGEDRERAYLYLTSSFHPGNVVDVALETDRFSNLLH